jgi:hypothetical protein
MGGLGSLANERFTATILASCVPGIERLTLENGFCGPLRRSPLREHGVSRLHCRISLPARPTTPELSCGPIATGEDTLWVHTTVGFDIAR